MTLHNPTTDPPKWSTNQRKMFEALINDFAKFYLEEPKATKQVRETIKEMFSITTTKDLTQDQLQTTITYLLDTIQTKQPNYQLQATKTL